MKLRFISLFISFALFMSSCNEDFLTKLPKDQLTVDNALNTYDNFKTYAWGLYDLMSGYGNKAQTYPGAIQQEFDSDNLSQSVAGNMSDYAFQTKTVPAQGANTTSLVTSKWGFSYVRRVNVMLDNINKSSMTQVDKNHWRSVGYFFRALRYYDLIAAYGDVTWVENALTDTATSVLYGIRTPRNIVAENILDNLHWAEANIKSSGDGANTINVHVVRALISRFGLFEGTWRKYHQLSNAEMYLQASKEASGKLLEDFPSVMDSYDNVFNSDDLINKPGIILSKQYVANLTVHALPRYTGSTAWHADVTKDAVESYLCTDGRPISTSRVYDGDKSMYNEFRNRDRRLYYTVLPPYKVKVGSPNNTWTKTEDSSDAEYVTLMNGVGGTNKVLPIAAWSRTMQTATIINMSPHFKKKPFGQSQAISELGYFFWKFYNRMPLDDRNNSSNDAPLFRIGEVMVNYAEATWELGEFNQSIANITINKLRERARVAPMNISEVTSSFDLNRDQSVDPVLWEIRRERRVELMGDGFRFNDLKRWRKGKYIDKQKLGVWVKNSDFGNALTIHGGDKEGYVEFFDTPLGWLDKYYLEPLPTQELVLNPNLKQNPGW